MIILLSVVLAAAILASMLMSYFTPNDSWLSFIGWVVFFLAIQSPFYLLPENSRLNCTAWISRLGRKS